LREEIRLLIKRILTLSVILLFIGVGVQSVYANNDDTTPPVTTHSLDPPEPDGLNGWYISDVNVTLTATDDISGVNVTYYRIRWSDWVLYTEPFTLSDDGDDILIEYYSVDFAGNVETKNSFYVSLDGTAPEVSMTYEMDYDKNIGWICIYNTFAIDHTSGMDYVEFYRDGILKETVYGPGPAYEWIWEYSNVTHIKGLIRNRKISEDKVEFKALIIKTEESMGKITHLTSGYDKAGNKESDAVLTPPPPGPLYNILLFKRLTLPNNYSGYVGLFFIDATFNTG
jgi:hypothetical protein